MRLFIEAIKILYAAIFCAYITGIVIFTIMVLDSEEEISADVTVDVDVNIRQSAFPLKATVYTALPTQTKTYLKLSSGKLVRNDSEIYKNRFCSISQDLSSHLNDGDTIDVVSTVPLLSGLWIVHDRMDSSMRQRIDFLVAPSDLKYFRQGIYPIKIKKFKS